MGGGVVQGSTYCAWPRNGVGESKQQYVDQSFKSMKELAKVAEDSNVIVNMEIPIALSIHFQYCCRGFAVCQCHRSPTLACCGYVPYEY